MGGDWRYAVHTAGHCNLDRSDDDSLTATERTPCPACGESGLLFRQSFGAPVGVLSSLSTSLLPGVQDRDWLGAMSDQLWFSLLVGLPRIGHVPGDKQIVAFPHRTFELSSPELDRDCFFARRSLTP